MSAANPKLSFSISARAKNQNLPIMLFLAQEYGFIPVHQIDSIFGFVEACTLYGGRIFEGIQVSEQDVSILNSIGIGLRLPLTNHYVTEKEYDGYKWLLEKYYRPVNSVITTNDELARWIRRDFPDYQLEASVIKNINTHADIEKELELYDTVVLPMHLNLELEFLDGIKQKERIRLFANGGCAFTCPSKICYPSISKINKFTRAEFKCSQPLTPREMKGMVDFDLEGLIAMGFHRYKLLRQKPGSKTGY
jgi:hypothetical protein